MKASEARQQSETNAKILAAEEEKAARAKAAAAKKADKAKHKKWYEDYRKSVRYSIESAVKYGSNKIERTLHSASSHTNLHYVDFFKAYEYIAELKKIMKELEDDGFDAKVVERYVEHDESIAYMNSGGECGSQTPYYTYDNILIVKW
jgi:hypothetical protein